LFLLPWLVNASPRPFIPESNKVIISRIISIAAHESIFGTTLNVLGNGKIPAYVTKTLDSPPKIAVDILCPAESLETINVAVKSPELEGLRVGHHPQKIRMVLDVNGVDIPHFAIASVDNEMTIFLSSEEINRLKEDEFNDAQQLGTDKDIATLDRTDEIKTDENQTHAKLAGAGNPAVDSSAPAPMETPVSEPETLGQEPKYIEQIRKDSERTPLQGKIYGSSLNQNVPDDGQEDTGFFIESLNAYELQDWSGAIEYLTLIIKTYPQGRYTERAYFLLAKAYEKQYSASISEHFNEIKGHYEDAIYKFLESEYGPDAVLGVGNLCFKNKNYYEAVGYYNLVLKKDKQSILAARALIQKTKIMLLKKRKDEALQVSAILDEVVSGLPEGPETTVAKHLRAQILYENNQYSESLEMLSKLKAADPESIYQHPEISLYLGYNFYQLGDNVKSREHLFRFYNSWPDHENSHTALTQIGDSYRNEGQVEDAAKFYQLVLKRYPDSEGAVISKIRLAEQQEEGTLKADNGLVSSVNLIGPKIVLAKETYEEIIKNANNNDGNKSLAQLALLKLAILYQKEANYRKSLEYLKILFKKYPRNSLKKESQYVLQKSIGGLFKQEMKAEKYVNIINLYLNEQELFEMVTAPGLFLAVARAFMNLNLEDVGAEMFKKADPLLSDEEKPADLLFLLGQDLYKQGNLKGALKKLSLLTDNYPNHNYTLYAYQLKGSILLKQKKYSLAVEMFSAALRYPLTRCEKLRILIDKAGALAENNFSKKSLAVVNQADEMKSVCNTSDHSIYKEIGDLYFYLDYTQKAADVFKQAAEMAAEDADKIALMLKVAECYLLLNKKEDFLALNEQISMLDDPFWSNLAKERMEEINFNWEMQRTKMEWKRKEKI